MWKQHIMYLNISTHTPHARRDNELSKNGIENIISTHTPHARRDKQESAKLLTYRTFQLTRLMRGVTDNSPK